MKALEEQEDVSNYSFCFTINYVYRYLSPSIYVDRHD